jgi:universal stress protein A
MLPIRKILAPIDFSEVSVETLVQASELTRHFQAELVVVHVIAPVPTLPADPNYSFEVPAYEEALRANSDKQLAEIVGKHVDDDIVTTRIVGYGDPAREIVRTADEEGADLIVIATHGLTGWQHLVFGSVAEKVVRQARCPVLTVRQGQSGE